MSIIVFAKIVQPTTLAEVFADIESLVPPGARAALRVEGGGIDPTSVPLEPFPVAEYEKDNRRYKEDSTLWGRGSLNVEMGTVAQISLVLSYRSTIEETEPGTYQPTEVEREQDERASGYHVRIDAGVLRTKASFCLAVLLATAIARRSGARIQDESGHLTGREWVELAPVLATFAKHADAISFEAFADGFCHDIGFAPNWPDSATLVGTDLTAR